MDRKAESRHRSGRRAKERRTEVDAEFSGPDRRTGTDRRDTGDRRRPR